MATTSRRTTRRGQASTYAPLHDRATFLSNEMWERAVKIADIMAQYRRGVENKHGKRQ